MNIELSVGEVKTVQAALEVYRKIKSAEKMLKGQREKNAEAMKPVFQKYDALLDIVKDVQTKLSTKEVTA